MAHIRLISVLQTKMARTLLRIAQSGCLAVALFAGMISAHGQELSQKQESVQEELNTIRSQISLSEQKRDELKAQIENLDKDRTTINGLMIETSKKSRVLEKRIQDTGARLAELRTEYDGVRASLGSKRGLLAEILGALQRMGRKPPPALLVTPDDALASVRSAILLGSVIPEIRAETNILLGELEELTRLAETIAARRDDLATDYGSLEEEQERLSLLLEEKHRLAGRAMSDLAEESARAAELAARATSLDQLITDLESQIASAREAAEAAKQAEEKRRASVETDIEDQGEKPQPFSDPGRIEPAIAFEAAKGLLPVPVSGTLLSTFGEDDIDGEPRQGISIAAQPSTRVLSPADGWIVYAGPFRSYGQLLIINAGQGYHIVLSGLENIDVRPGQFVIVGEPLGKMGAQRLASADFVDVSTSTPILYLEFRKDGKSIDPSPWWADENLGRGPNGS